MAFSIVALASSYFASSKPFEAFILNHKQVSICWVTLSSLFQVQPFGRPVMRLTIDVQLHCSMFLVNRKNLGGAANVAIHVLNPRHRTNWGDDSLTGRTLD